jgi:hypothetical protein
MALPCHPLSPRRQIDIIRTHDKVGTRLRPRPFIKNVVPKTGLEPVSLAAADFKSDVYTIPPLGPTIRHRAMKVVLGNTVMINGKNCLRSLLLRLYVGF